MSLVPTLRLVIFSLSLLMAFIVLVLSAHMASTSSFDGIILDFEGLGIANAVLTIIAIPIFLVFGIIRKDSWFTMNIVEIPTLGVLWILWMALAAHMANLSAFFTPFTCGVYQNTFAEAYCQEFRAVEGFAFVIWLMLLGYSATITVLCFIGRSRGNTVWSVSASVANYFQHSPSYEFGSKAATTNTGTAVPSSYPLGSHAIAEV